MPAAVRWLLDAAGVAGLAVIGLLVWRTNQYSDFMFRGGLVVLSVATAATVAAVVTPGSLLGRALGCRPLRWIGVRSYGIYLWHYPVIVLTAAVGAAGSPVSPGRAVVVVAGDRGRGRGVLAGHRGSHQARGPAALGHPGQSNGKTTEAKATGGADMTGEPGTNAAGGGRRPGGEAARAAALAAGDRRDCACWARPCSPRA